MKPAHDRSTPPPPPAALVRPAFALLALALCLAASPVAAAPPLTTADLVRLAEAGVGEKLLGRLVADRGLASELGVEDVVELKAVGLSDAFVGQLLAVTDAEPRELSWREEDGVVVVEGRGSPDVSGEADPEPAASDDPWSEGPSEPSPVVVLGAQAPPLSSAGEAPPHSSAAEAADENPYPFGAVFGRGGGAVFLPARFGPGSSAFGRTIIVDGASHRGSHWPHWPYVPPVVAPTPVGSDSAVTGSTGSVALPGFSLQSGHGSSRTVPVKTSRGVIHLPN